MIRRIITYLFAATVLAIGFFSLFSNFNSNLTAVHPRIVSAAEVTTVFYDGSLGGTPDTQSMEYETVGIPFSSQATQSFNGGKTTLDTTPEISDYAGYGITETLIPTLDRTDGFKLNFTIQVESETHSNNDRSGFSVILLASDNQGIELAFWENEIWAQEGGTTDLLSHAEGASFDTTSGLISYELEIVGDVYTLSSANVTLLTGSIRDYTANEPPFGLPDPYEVPNFVFLGDNTTSGKSKIHLSFVSVTTGTAVPATSTPTATHTSTPNPTNTATPTATQTPTPTNTPGGPVDEATSTPTPVHQYLPFITNP